MDPPQSASYGTPPHSPVRGHGPGRLNRSIPTPPRELAAENGAHAYDRGYPSVQQLVQEGGSTGAEDGGVCNGGGNHMGDSYAPVMNTARYRSRVLPRDALDPRNPQIKRDIIRMIAQYLHNESYFASLMVLQDEANMKTSEQQSRRAQSKRLRKAVLEGDWDVAASLAKNLPRQHHKRYLYALYRQEYMELIEKQEYQKAFAYLNRRLKPMEATAASNPTEFQNLCYLLTCKSVADSPHFMGWEGVMAGREKLSDELARLVEVEGGAAAAVPSAGASLADASQEIPPDRLVTLLQQAVAYQMEFRRYHPRMVPEVTSLARDYQCPVVPNVQRDLFVGHCSSVKAVEWCGEEGFLLAAGAGGGDFGISLWSSNPGVWPSNRSAGADMDELSTYEVAASPLPAESASGTSYSRRGSWQGGALSASVGRGRSSISSFRSGSVENGVHGCCTDAGDEGGGYADVGLGGLRGAADASGSDMGSRLASASGDGTVRLWALPSNVALAQGDLGGSDDSDSQPIGTSLATLTGHQSDVYSVAFHPDQSHVVTGGHDRVVRLYDVRAVKELKSFAGHEAGVLQATTNAHGNLLVSGSRDGTVRFWDVLSGVCVRTLTQPLGAVTSVQVSRDGLYLLTSSRHGSVRLWDLRIGSDERPLQRFRGHQNTSSSFLRATFAAEESLILGGSDCGALHVWDRKNGDLIQKLKGHSGAAYRGTWSDKQSMAASCGEDGTVRTWWWQDHLQEADDGACACAAADTQPLYEARQEQRQEQGVELPAELSAEASAEPQPSAADRCSAEQPAA